MSEFNSYNQVLIEAYEILQLSSRQIDKQTNGLEGAWGSYTSNNITLNLLTYGCTGRLTSTVHFGAVSRSSSPLLSQEF